MQAQWGCLICLEECLQYAVSLILWESSRLAEQPSTGSCLNPSVTGAVVLLYQWFFLAKVAELKNRRKCSLLDTAFSVELGRVWKIELTNEMSVQIIPQLAFVGHRLLKSRLQLPCPEIKIFILKISKASVPHPRQPKYRFTLQIVKEKSIWVSFRYWPFIF